MITFKFKLRRKISSGWGKKEMASEKNTEKD